jgi:hypothetical protein
MSQLHGLPPQDVHSIELYSGGTMIRVYTEQFVARAAREARRIHDIGCATLGGSGR